MLRKWGTLTRFDQMPCPSRRLAPAASRAILPRASIAAFSTRKSSERRLTSAPSVSLHIAVTASAIRSCTGLLLVRSSTLSGFAVE